MKLGYLAALTLFAALLLGCVQQADTTKPTTLPTIKQAATPTAAAKATAAPENKAATASPSTATAPSTAATATPAATPAKAASPSPTAAPTTAAPTLEDFATHIQDTATAFLNSTQKKRLTANDEWTVSDILPDYRFTVFIKPSKVHWTQGEVRYNVTNNVTQNEIEVHTGANANIYSTNYQTAYNYRAIMKCHGQRYDVELHLSDMKDVPVGSGNYRTTLGTDTMAMLTGVCPR